MQLMSEQILSISGLNFAYNGSPVLEDVNLSVNKGDYIAVLGPNGGGKTTLIKCILGLLSPQAGTVSVFGQAPARVRHRIGYVPQYTTTQDNFPITVLDVVLLGAMNATTNIFSAHWKRSRGNVDKARNALHMVGLDGRENYRLHDLSGGQRQRVIVARALMGDPDLLLLDEPTANIDPQGKFCFYEFLASLPREITTIVVSHDLSIAASPFTGMAVVNRSLHYASGNALTQDLLAMLYGTHEPTCPMGSFINSVSNLFPDVGTMEPPHLDSESADHGTTAVTGTTEGNAGRNA